MRRIALAVLVAAVAASLPACGPGPREVRITIRHSAFDPAVIEAAPGEVVRFVIENADPIDHEFILGDLSVQNRHESGTEPSHGAKPGEISVPAGDTATTTFEFADAGTLLFGCHLPGHFAYGMKGEVHVG